MTRKEKAKEVAAELFEHHILRDAAYDGALKMAELKDKEFVERIKSISVVFKYTPSELALASEEANRMAKDILLDKLARKLKEENFIQISEEQKYGVVTITMKINVC